MAVLLPTEQPQAGNQGAACPQCPTASPRAQPFPAFLEDHERPQPFSSGRDTRPHSTRLRCLPRGQQDHVCPGPPFCERHSQTLESVMGNSAWPWGQARGWGMTHGAPLHPSLPTEGHTGQQCCKHKMNSFLLRDTGPSLSSLSPHEEEVSLLHHQPSHPVLEPGQGMRHSCQLHRPTPVSWRPEGMGTAHGEPRPAGDADRQAQNLCFFHLYLSLVPARPVICSQTKGANIN